MGKILPIDRSSTDTARSLVALFVCYHAETYARYLFASILAVATALTHRCALTPITFGFASE